MAGFDKSSPVLAQGDAQQHGRRNKKYFCKQTAFNFPYQFCTLPL